LPDAYEEKEFVRYKMQINLQGSETPLKYYRHAGMQLQLSVIKISKSEIKKKIILTFSNLFASEVRFYIAKILQSNIKPR